MHVRALMNGVGSMKRYRKEGSERRLRGDAGFANKANPPSGLRPCPPPPFPLEQREKGGKEKGGGGGRKGGSEGKGRVGSEGARTRDND